MRTETYFVQNGRLCIFKTPDARLLYALDLVDWLKAAGTVLKSVSACTAGVELSGSAFVSGTKILAWVTGLDESPDADNYCTFNFRCVDGSADQRTIHFLKRPG